MLTLRNKYVQWLYSNKLKINSDKTKYIVFKQKNKIVEDIDIKINNNTLERVTSVGYLGLTIDDKLNWKKHVIKITGKIVVIIPSIFKIRNYITDKTKKLVVQCLFLVTFSISHTSVGDMLQNYF